MRLDDLTISELLSQVAAKTPAPGGGAVASVVAALAASLAQMVLHFSEGKKLLAGHVGLHREAIAAMERFRTTSLDLAEADANAYSALNALWKLDREHPTRTAQWGEAVAAAIDAPMQVVNETAAMLDLIERLVGCTSKSLDSDLAIAAVLAEAAMRAAAWNVRINLPLLEDKGQSSGTEQELDRCLVLARRKCAAIEAALRTR